MQKRFLSHLLAIILLTGCQPDFTDMSQNLEAREISKIPTGKYTGIAWASDTTLVLEVDQGNLFVDQRMCTRQAINIYEMKTEQVQTLPLPFAGECHSYIIRNLQTLPNQLAGYVFEYPKLNTSLIKSVDVRSATETDLYAELPGKSSLDTFAYSPDMKELLVVDVQSPLLKSAIYLLDTNGTRTNITSDFLRADFPVWSLKRNLIAFLGTKPYSGDDDKIKQFSQLESRVDYPWRLYIYNPQELTTKEISLDIVHPSSLKWFPDGTRLAFSGEYEGVEGIWIINNVDKPESITVTRIIKDLATFDFSPDGKSIAFAYIGLQNQDKQNILYFVNVTK